MIAAASCTVTSIVVNPMPVLYFDIGKNLPKDVPYPSITVTPAECTPYVPLTWTKTSTETYVTVDDANKKFVVSTKDTALVSSTSKKI